MEVLMTDASTTQGAKQAAANVADDAVAHARDVVDSARSEARSVTREAQDQAADVVRSARTELRAQASEQAKRLSETLGDFGRQLGDMADASPEPESQMSQLARSAAGTLSERARRMDEQGIDGAVEDVKRFARNRPAAFLLGSVAVGFAIGRLAKHADLGEIAQHAKEELDPDALKSSVGSSASPSPGDVLPEPSVSDRFVPTGASGSGDRQTVSEVVHP